jgi:hypothetical protein
MALATDDLVTIRKQKIYKVEKMVSMKKTKKIRKPMK